MDNQEAKFILETYRPGGQDAADPHFTEALEQARLDPALGQWFAQEQALDSAIAGKLQSVPVPAGLKAAILAGHNVINKPAAFQPRRQWLALAAGIAVLLSLAVFWIQQPRSQPEQFTQFHADMSQFLNSIDRLDLQTDDLAKIRHWLDTHQGHSNLVLPAKLDGQPSIGCRVMDWRNKKVSLVCYYLRSPDSNKIDEMHLLVIDRDELADPPPSAQPQFVTTGKWETASWSDNRHSYILAGLAKGNYLKSYMGK